MTAGQYVSFFFLVVTMSSSCQFIYGSVLNQMLDMTKRPHPENFPFYYHNVIISLLQIFIKLSLPASFHYLLLQIRNYIIITS